MTLRVLRHAGRFARVAATGAAIVAVVITASSASASTLTIPSILSVPGTAYTQALGTSFAVVGNYTGADLMQLTAVGEVDLAGGLFTTNAAGVITRPTTTNTGRHPGETSPALPGALLPGAPYAALLIGNTALGFHTVFVADASTGLGSATPPTTLVLSRTLADIFGSNVSIADGTVLTFAINDINNGDNTGGYRLVPGTQPVPEPASMLLLGTGLAGLGRRAWRKARR